MPLFRNALSSVTGGEDDRGSPVPKPFGKRKDGLPSEIDVFNFDGLVLERSLLRGSPYARLSQFKGDLTGIHGVWGSRVCGGSA